MRLEAVSNQTPQRQIALVLADQGIGALLSERLRGEGFETRLQAPPRLNSTPEQLRSFLVDFAEKERKSGHLWVHPGVTPLAERSEWPALGRELGFGFIGPPARSLSLFNNRLTLLGEAEKLSIPNLLLVQDPLNSVREIEKLLRKAKIKFPFVLKSVRGGSGIGVRVIHQPEDLGRSLNLWLEQIKRNLGEVIILAEKYVEGARRIAQPFVRHADGEFQLLPATDASLTSRLRKIIEFCPATYGSTGSEPESVSLKRVREWTEALARQTGYVGVGSLEYLVEDSRAFLIEGVPRLNTGFWLWEKVSGASAVALQLAAMSGPEARIPKSQIPEWKTALGVRIYAEDPVLQLPQPGAVIEAGEKNEWVFPGAEGKLNLAIQADEEVSTAESSVLAYLWVGAEDPKRAITVARGILDELWISGTLQTNERFLQELLTHPWIQEGIFHASFVDEDFIPSLRPDPEVMFAFAAMAQLLTDDPSSSTHKWAVGDQWIKKSGASVRWKGEPEYFTSRGKRGLRGVLQSERGQSLRAFCFPLTEDRWQGRIGNWFFPIRRVATKPQQTGTGKQKLSALLSGRIHSILFREGAWVPAHEPAVVIESMGALIPHALPVDVKLIRWHVGAEDAVGTGQMLAEFERAPEVR